MTFNNEQALRAAIEKKLGQAAKHTVDKVLKKYEPLIIQNVYNAYNPTEYSRTFDFYRAWRTFQDGTSAEMRYVTTSMFSSPPYHASVVTGESSEDFLPDILYTDCKPGVFPNGTWNKKRMAWDKLEKWFDDDRLRKEFQYGMNAAGISYESHPGEGITKTEIN